MKNHVDIENRIDGKAGNEIRKELDREEKRLRILTMCAVTGSDWSAIHSAKKKLSALRNLFTGGGIEYAAHVPTSKKRGLSPEANDACRYADAIR